MKVMYLQIGNTYIWANAFEVSRSAEHPNVIDVIVNDLHICILDEPKNKVSIESW
jgi:hypothetical protein